MAREANAVMLVSGGIDSYACGRFLLQHGFAVTGLFVDYCQQAHECEGVSVRSVCAALKIPLRVVRLIYGEAFAAGEILGRNWFLIATALLTSKKRLSGIGFGLHAGSPYYDCSDAFFDRVDTLVTEHTGGRTALLAPFRSRTKQQVYSY